MNQSLHSFSCGKLPTVRNSKASLGRCSAAAHASVLTGGASFKPLDPSCTDPEKLERLAGQFKSAVCGVWVRAISSMTAGSESPAEPDRTLDLPLIAVVSGSSAVLDLEWLYARSVRSRRIANMAIAAKTFQKSPLTR